MGFISRFRISSAIKSGKVDRVTSLLEAGGDANESSSAGITVLMLAASMGHPDIVNVLLDHGAKVNEIDQNGLPALFHAIHSAKANAVKALLDRGADAMIETTEGVSAHDLALKQGGVRIMKLLMAARASREN